MPDAGKVVRGLKCCTNDDEAGCRCKECPYGTNDHGTCDTIYQLMKEALELIEVPKPAKPREERYEIKIKHVWGDEVDIRSKFYCPHCGKMIASGESKRYPWCMWCGKPILWEWK